MCGIFGYISDKELNDSAVLKSMAPRGPDAEGVSTFRIQSKNGEQQCTLLHRRLSIIDLSISANQPMIDESKSYCIIFNGEIYNYRELRRKLEKAGYLFSTRSDTEVLLKGYIHWKEGVLNKIRGMFAFCVFDSLEQKLFMARDHFGQKPLYYYHDHKTFCFSSTISTFLRSGVHDKFTISKNSIKFYLAFGSFIAPDTIIEEIKLLMPGHFLIYKLGEIQISKYFDPRHYINNEATMEVNETPHNTLRDILFRSIEQHMRSDVPLGIFLSGGIDSSLIAGIASKVSKEKIHTFSLGFKDKTYSYADETDIARKTSKFLNSIHKNIYIDENDFDSSVDDFINAIDVPSVDGLNMYFISKAIRPHLKVVLSGLGGDEMFCGYPVFKEVYKLFNLKRIDKYIYILPTKLLNRVGKSYLRYFGCSLFDILMDKRLIGKSDKEIESKMKEYIAIDGNNILKSLSVFEISNYMANMLLRDTDAITSHFSLECRVPFVDIEVFRFTMSVTDGYKVTNSINKPLLVRTFSDLLIEETYKRPKQGFVLPVSRWLNQHMNRERIKELYEVACHNDLFTDKCPFKGDGKIWGRETGSHYYKWFILLKWIKANQSRIQVRISK